MICWLRTNDRTLFKFQTYTAQKNWSLPKRESFSQPMKQLMQINTTKFYISFLVGGKQVSQFQVQAMSWPRITQDYSCWRSEMALNLGNTECKSGTLKWQFHGFGHVQALALAVVNFFTVSYWTRCCSLITASTKANTLNDRGPCLVMGLHRKYKI